MTPELQKYYENRLEMMASEAWKDLMEDVKVMKEATDTTSGINDLLALGIRKGEIRIMDWLLSIKDTSEKAYQQLKDEDAATS